MSDLVTYASYSIKDIPALPLKNMLQGLIADADYVMGANMEDGEAIKLTTWLVNFLYEKYGYLPMTHVAAAITEGSIGRRQGTSKLVPRNLIIWISEQEKIFQEQYVAAQKKKDDDRRRSDLSKTKVDNLIARAVNIKIGWRCDGRIPGDMYDRVSTQKIYDLLKSGRLSHEIKLEEVMI